MERATPEEVETWALKRGLPERGSGLGIYRVERPILRYWLTTCGVPKEVTRLLTSDQLAAAWHDTTGATLERLKTS